MEMPREKKPGILRRALFLVLAAAVVSSGQCSVFKTKGAAPPLLQEDFSRLRPEDFPGKIKQLEEVSQRHKTMAVRTRALFYVALACMHYNNPSPDYAKAAQYLDQYIGRQTGRKDIDELVAWKSVLQTLGRSLQDYAKLKQQFDRATKNGESLARKLGDLNQVIESQKKEIERLKETIKELDAVQQEIEKKRKAIIKSYPVAAP